ncbi:MAG: TetR/AcrR family transcriptional regulator [Candidatus Cloacimonetes bacterium]|nr:TetR/AcrR family transcriptional regulator [Candidatus Cloacimonadota bacterium]
MNRKQRENLLRRREMLEAARKLFLKKGFDNVTMVEIARKAEFSRVTLYSYFKSKYEIFYELISQAFHDDFDKYLSQIVNVSSSHEKLVIYGHNQYEFFKREPGYHLLTVQYRTQAGLRLNLSENTIKILQERRERMDSQFHTIFREGIRNGEFRSDLNIEVAITYFLKAIFAIVHPYVFNPRSHLSDLDIEMEYLLRAFQV